jgi:hypothetical protein
MRGHAGAEDAVVQEGAGNLSPPRQLILLPAVNFGGIFPLRPVAEAPCLAPHVSGDPRVAKRPIPAGILAESVAFR